MFLDHLRPAVALVTLCLIFVQGRAHQAQQLPSAPPVAQASLARTAPVLGGKVLDDPAWQDVPAPVEFWQTAPDAGQPSSERTEVRIVYTESAIYFGVVLLDRDPSGLTTSDSRRDSPLDDTDSFRIALDTYRDRQNGFVFATTPSGLEYDGQLNGEGTNNPFGGGGGGGGGGGRQFGGSGGGFNLNWDGAWKVQLPLRLAAAGQHRRVHRVYTDSHLLDESPFRPSNADRSFIVKISRMFDALR